MKVKSIKRGTKNHTWDIEVGNVHEYTVYNLITHNSSQLTGETNGIEPPVDPVTTKTSKDGALKIVVPSIHRLKNKYDYRWDQTSPRGYLTLMGVLQKWVDQAISSNVHYNPENYQDGIIPMSDLMKDFVYAMKIGLKTLYYDNTNDGGGEVADEKEPEVTELEPIDEEECDSCVI